MASSLFALDLSGAPLDVITLLFKHMDLHNRFTCALVCCDWAKAAAEATKSICRHGLREASQLQPWLEIHGGQLEALHLHASGDMASLPCAQLQDLLLHSLGHGNRALGLDSRVWSDIAAASKLTSISLDDVATSPQQADVVSALAALPDLQQLTWGQVELDTEKLWDSRLLQQLTSLTGLELVSVAAEALQHLRALTKLQRLSICPPRPWAAANYPGLQELQLLTSLQLQNPTGQQPGNHRFPACVSHLTALQQLEVSLATFQELNSLTALTALTKLQVAKVAHSPAQLCLPALQHVILEGENDGLGFLRLHPSSLAGFTQLRYLSLSSVRLSGPGSLVVSSMLEELDLHLCSIGSGDDGPAAVCRWEFLLPGQGRLPHLTSLVLHYALPQPEQADFERLAACCSGLQSLHLAYVPYVLSNILGILPMLPFPHLTQLKLSTFDSNQCSTLAHQTGLRELLVDEPYGLSADSVRYLALLEQLISLKFPTFAAFKRSQRNCTLQNSQPLLQCCVCCTQRSVSPGGAPGVLQRCNGHSTCYMITLGSSRRARAHGMPEPDTQASSSISSLCSRSCHTMAKLNKVAMKQVVACYGQERSPMCTAAAPEPGVSMLQ